MVKTKIFFVGSFEPWSLESSYVRAFRKLGYEPVCFDMEGEYKKSSWQARNRYTNRIFLPYVARRMNEKLEAALKNFWPDLVFFHKGKFVRPGTLAKIREDTKASLFTFNPDDPFSSNWGASSGYIKRSIPYYDAYFIWAKALVPKLKNAGAKHAEYLPFACDPELHYPISLTEEDRKVYGSEVVFVGNWDEEREKWLSGLEGYDMAIWGSGYWKTRCRNNFLRSSWRGRAVVGNEMSKVCAASKINLNVLRFQNKGSHNMRTFEIPACGAFMLHERSEEVLGFFEEGKEMECFGSIKELKDKVDFYLNNDNLRLKIAKEGYRRCSQEGYSYIDRAKQLLKTYDRLSGSR